MRLGFSGAVAFAALSTVSSIAIPGPAAQDTPAAITFTRHVAPLIFDRCAQCHQPNGSAPFSLLSYADVRQRATQIAAVTRSRYMPPWKATPESGEFVGQRHLSDAEIDLIQRWIDGGHLEGNPRDLPPAPRQTLGWQLGTPDLILTMPSYGLSAEGTDVFRTFVLRVPTTSVRYVRGLEFRPNNPRVVHHANIRIDRTPASRDLDRQDPAPGYDGVMANSAQFPDGHFLAWTPGQAAPLLPDGMAWRLEPGTDLVFQVHLQPSGKPESVDATIGLYFGEEPPERTPSIVRLGRQDIDIRPGDANYVIEDSYTLPVAVEVHAVQPHAHTRARLIDSFATMPDGSKRPLVSIRDWDFRWQHVYRYATPFVLPAGATLSMRFTYDNSADNPRNPTRPPGRVRYGWQTGDEMGELYLQVLTGSEADRAALERSFNRKAMADDIVGYESLIERSAPNAAGLHDDVAFLYLEFGRHDRAIAHFEAAVRLQPLAPFPYFNLGTALVVAGQPEQAVPYYREAVRLDPDYAVAYNQLGRTLEQLGRPDEAIQYYQEALRAAPGLAAAHNNVGLVLLRRGDIDGAVSRFQDAVRIDSTLADAHFNLGHALRARGDTAEAMTHFREAVRLKPDDQAFRQALENLK